MFCALKDWLYGANQRADVVLHLTGNRDIENVFETQDSIPARILKLDILIKGFENSHVWDLCQSVFLLVSQINCKCLSSRFQFLENAPPIRQVNCPPLHTESVWKHLTLADKVDTLPLAFFKMPQESHRV